MADLQGTQLKNGFQTLVTIGATTTSDPTTGALTNGKDTAITQVTLGLGSASAPSYSFTGDTNTGIFSSGADTLNLSTNGSSRLSIASDGNITINKALSVTDGLSVTTSNEEVIRLTRSTTTNDSFIDLTYASGNSSTAGANHEYSKIRTKVVANLENLESSELHFQTINSGTIGDKMVITKEGNVGIGETSVDAKLHLTTATAGLVNQKFESAGSAAWRLGVPASQTYFAFDNANDDLSSPKVIIDTNGNMAIGASSASQKLSVTGNIGTSGSVLFDDNQGVKFGNVNAQITGSSANGLMFFAGGSEAMRFNASGQLGIGTTSNTTFALEVVANATDGVLAVKNGANDRNTFRSSNAAGTRTLDIGNNSSGHGILNIRNSGGTVNTQLLGDGTSYFNGGSVAIGATSASKKLEVHDASSTTTANDGGATIVIKNTNNTDNNQGSLAFLNSAGTKTASIISTFIDHSTDEGALSFAVGDGGGSFGEAMRITANKRIGIGTTSPENNFHIAGTNTVAMTLQAPTNDSSVASTATMNYKYQSSGGAAIGKIQLVEKSTNSFNGQFVFGLPFNDSGQSTRDIMTIDFNGDILPAVDSLSDIGSSSNRFVNIHADNGTIQTSDKNQKQDFEKITEAEAKVAQKAKGLLTKYKWIKDVEKYGDDAQYHIGIIAQELIAAFEEEGLNYKKYAMIYESEHLEDSGEMTTYYGVRYTELLAFIISTL